MRVLVWDRMEELHPDFFQAYKLKRKIADQIRVCILYSNQLFLLNLKAYNHLHKAFIDLESRNKNNTPQVMKNNALLPTTKPILTRNSYHNMLNISKEKSQQDKQNEQNEKENQYPNLPQIHVRIGPSHPATKSSQPPTQSNSDARPYSRPQPHPPSLKPAGAIYVAEEEPKEARSSKTNLQTLLEAATALEEDQ